MLGEIETFTSSFEGLETSGQSMACLQAQYNEYAQCNGFRLHRGTTTNYINLSCAHNRDKTVRIEKSWKPTKEPLNCSKSQQSCPVEVIFKREFQGSIWVLSQIVSDHNHARDHSILPPSITLYLDHFMSAQTKKPSPSQIAEHLSQKFQREFHIPSLFHHIAQRFHVHHNTEALSYF